MQISLKVDANYCKFVIDLFFMNGFVEASENYEKSYKFL